MSRAKQANARSLLVRCKVPLGARFEELSPTQRHCIEALCANELGQAIPPRTMVRVYHAILQLRARAGR